MKTITRKQRRDWLFALVLLLPSVYVLFRVFVYPIYQSAVWSFFHYNFLDGSAIRFIGLKNYLNLVHSQDFWMSIWRASYFTIFTCVVELVLGFFSALLLNQMFRGRIFFRAIIIIPWAMLTLVNGLLWNWIYQPGFGALSVILHVLHILGPQQNPLWLAQTNSVVWFAGIADIWKMTPFMTLLLLAGLQSISTEMYEAAMIDGAGFWKKIWYVTIPLLMPSIIVAVVLRVMGAFRVYDILTIFTGDPTSSVTYLTFNNAFRYFYLGKASAMAWFSTIFILVLVIMYIRVLKKNMDQN